MSGARSRLLVVLALLGAVLAGLAPPAGAAYPGADGSIAFNRADQIFTVSPDGTGERQLTSVERNFRPRWSPDGTRIAFVRELPDGRRDVWVMRADGTDQQQVTRGGKVDAPPSWSPDGSQLVFSNSPAVGSELQVVRTTPPYGKPVPLRGRYRDAPDDREPLSVRDHVAWSPDGQTIAFYSAYYPDSSPDDFLLLYATATQEVSVYYAINGGCCGFGSFGDFSFGPRNGRLAYTYVNLDESPRPTIDIDEFPTRRELRFDSLPGDRQPAFSPTGTRVAFSNGGTLLVAAADGTRRRTLVEGVRPDWQPLPG